MIQRRQPHSGFHVHTSSFPRLNSFANLGLNHNRRVLENGIVLRAVRRFLRSRMKFMLATRHHSFGFADGFESVLLF